MRIGKNRRVKCSISDCFACKDGECIALQDNDFNGKPCPFFKTRDQIADEEMRTQIRLRKRYRTSV